MMRAGRWNFHWAKKPFLFSFFGHSPSPTNSAEVIFVGQGSETAFTGCATASCNNIKECIINLAGEHFLLISKALSHMSSPKILKPLIWRLIYISQSFTVLSLFLKSQHQHFGPRVGWFVLEGVTIFETPRSLLTGEFFSIYLRVNIIEHLIAESFEVNRRRRRLEWEKLKIIV